MAANGPEFEHDVYVSFRHTGDPMGPGGAAWTERVVSHASMALRERTGRLFNIRLDRQPSLSRQERERVERRILRSKLFVAVISPGYLAEERAQWEMEIALSPGSMVRAALIVESMPAADEEAAAGIADLPTMVFWEHAPNGDAVTLAPDYNRALFMERVGQLADIIAGALAEIERLETEPPPPEPAAPPQRPSEPVQSIPPLAPPPAPEPVPPRAMRPLQMAPTEARPAAPAKPRPAASPAPDQRKAFPLGPRPMANADDDADDAQGGARSPRVRTPLPPADRRKRRLGPLVVVVMMLAVVGVAAWFFRAEIMATAGEVFDLLSAPPSDQ